MFCRPIKKDKEKALKMNSSENMGGSAEVIGGQMARHKSEAQRVLRDLRTDIEKHPDLSAAHKQAIGSLVDSLDEQIGLIQSASRETLASARRQIQDGMHKVSTELNHALGKAEIAAKSLRPSLQACGRAIDNLNEQLEAAEKGPGTSEK
jgi:hypothetical protein